MAKKRKRKKSKLVPPQGPAVNLRPAGAHQDKRRPSRAAAEREALAEHDAPDVSSSHDGTPME